MELRRDLLAGLRGLRRTPGVALLVVLTLGLAIGANATVFSLIDRVAMRPLPVEKPHELVLVSAPMLPRPSTGQGAIMISAGAGKAMGMDYPLVTALRDGLADMFSAVAIRRTWRFTLAADTAVEVSGEFVNGEYFTVVGLRTIIGRMFTAAETSRGRSKSHRRAPRARQTAVSCDRTMPRASSRLATLPAATTRTNTVIAISSRSGTSRCTASAAIARCRPCPPACCPLVEHRAWTRPSL